MFYNLYFSTMFYNIEQIPQTLLSSCVLLSIYDTINIRQYLEHLVNNATININVKLLLINELFITQSEY